MKAIEDLVDEVVELEMQLADAKQATLECILRDSYLTKRFLKIDWAGLRKEMLGHGRPKVMK